jgi:hypothetical protein
MKILRHPDDPDYSGHLNEGDDVDEQPRVRSMHSSVNFADAENGGVLPANPSIIDRLSVYVVCQHRVYRAAKVLKHFSQSKLLHTSYIKIIPIKSLSSQ